MTSNVCLLKADLNENKEDVQSICAETCYVLSIFNIFYTKRRQCIALGYFYTKCIALGYFYTKSKVNWNWNVLFYTRLEMRSHAGCLYNTSLHAYSRVPLLPFKFSLTFEFFAVAFTDSICCSNKTWLVMCAC